MNGRQRGHRGERQGRDELRAHGYAARRGQQFAGSPDSPNVVCESLPWLHFEESQISNFRSAPTKVPPSLTSSPSIPPLPRGESRGEGLAAAHRNARSAEFHSAVSPVCNRQALDPRLHVFVFAVADRKVFNRLRNFPRSPTLRGLNRNNKQQKKNSMLLQCKESSQPHPEGIHPAICVDVIDLGMVEVDFQGQRKMVNKLKLVFESEQKTAEGRNWTVSKNFTASLHPKAKLAEFLGKWRGRVIVPGETIDMTKLIGACCTLVISHQQNMVGRTYASIDAISKPSKKLAASGHYDPAEMRRRIADSISRQSTGNDGGRPLTTAAVQSPVAPSPAPTQPKSQPPRPQTQPANTAPQPDYDPEVGF